MQRRRRLPPLSPLVALAGCALVGPRPGPPPDAPTESALSAAPPPAVCKVSPRSLRRVGPLEAGVTPLGRALALLGEAPLADGAERACWRVTGDPDAVLFVTGRIADQPIRSVAISDPDTETERGCGATGAIAAPLALEAGLRPGMARPAVEEILGPIEVDAGGSFGRECCGLEATGEGESGPVYGFGCSAVLGVFKEGRLASVVVSRYAPPKETGR